MNPIVIRFGGYQKPASINNAAARLFGEVLQARLGDRIRFELVGNVLDLGRPSGDLPMMVKSGELSLCYISAVRFTDPVPEFKLLELPFIVKDRHSIHQAFAGKFGDLCRRHMRDATAFRLLGLWDNGFRHLTNRVRPIRTPADCRGLRIRTQMSELHGEALRALGFVPIAVDVKEFVEQIAGERFDAQENPLTNTFNFGVHNYHRYITLTGHFFGATVMICNAQHYESWPPQVRDAVEEAARQATTLQLELAAAEDEQILAKLENTIPERSGGFAFSSLSDPQVGQAASRNEVIHLTEAERAEFVAAVQPVLLKYRKELDPQLFAWIEQPS